MGKPLPAGATLAVLAAVLVVLIPVAAAVGAVAVPLDQTLAVLLKALGLPVAADPKWETIVHVLRLPRVVGAALIGAALAVAGTVMQGLLRNPMADPGLVGVSAGAGFGAVSAIALGVAAQAAWTLPVFASLGSLTAAGIIFALSIRGGRLGVFTLLLAGIAVSTFFGACTSLILSFSSRDSVAQFLFWSLGNLSNLRWEPLGLVALVIGAGLLVLGTFVRDLNILLLGEEEAQSVGLDVFRTRIVLLVVVSVTTAAAVCLCGPIGFVGLIVPHTLRLVTGPDHRLLLPASALGGASFLVACDLVARTIQPGREVNVGIVTALLGAPYFLFLLLRSEKKGLV